MKYSEEFIIEVKAVYPNSPIIHRLAEEGNFFLGRYLCDSISDGVANEVVLKANNLSHLKELAEDNIRKAELYNKWTAETRKDREQ